MLVEAGPRLLGGVSEALSVHAGARLRLLGVEVLTRYAVEDIQPDGISIAGQRTPIGLVIWAAGVSASPLARQLGATGRAGRIAVDEFLAVPGHKGVFALSDVAAFTEEDSRPLPSLAQVAKQQGIHFGTGLAARIRDGRSLAPLRYASRATPRSSATMQPSLSMDASGSRAGSPRRPRQSSMSTSASTTGSLSPCNGSGAISPMNAAPN